MKSLQLKLLFIGITGIAAGIACLLLDRFFAYLVPLRMLEYLTFISCIQLFYVLTFPCKFGAKLAVAAVILVVSPIPLFSISFLPDASIFWFIAATYYTPFGTTLTTLVTILFRSKAERIIKDSIQCPSCGTSFASNEAFCPNCHKLSPEVKKTINRYPQKKYADFIPDIKNGRRFCPHCGRYYKRSDTRMNMLGTPIRRCGKCRHFLMNLSYCEWEYLSVSQHLRHALHPDPFLLLGLAFIYATILEYNDVQTAVIGFLISLPLSAVWKAITISEAAEASKQRFKVNPEYPKLLKFMGYENV